MNSRESVGQLVERLHRRVAPVGASMSLALSKRSARVSELEAWARELRDCSDALDEWVRSRPAQMD